MRTSWERSFRLVQKPPSDAEQISRKLERSLRMAQELTNVAKQIKGMSLRLAPILYPTFRSPIPIEQRSAIYDKLFVGMGELFRLPELIMSLLENDEREVVYILVARWVEAIVEVLRVWDDLSGGIIDVAEVVSAATREPREGETVEIIGEMGEIEEAGFGDIGAHEATAQGNDGSVRKTSRGRRTSRRRTKRNN